MINYEYYKIFYYVGKYKSITKAAQMLYSSQPAVTRIIQKLENELECKLFVRSQAGMDFTQEGKTLFDYVSIAYNQLERGEDEIRRCAVGETGTIYIGASVTSLHVFLFDALDLFHSRYPNVRLKILTGSNNGTLEKLKNGLVHLAFVSTPFNASGAFKISRIKKFHDILIAGKDFDDLRGKTLSVQDSDPLSVRVPAPRHATSEVHRRQVCRKEPYHYARRGGGRRRSARADDTA